MSEVPRYPSMGYRVQGHLAHKKQPPPLGKHAGRASALRRRSQPVRPCARRRARGALVQGLRLSNQVWGSAGLCTSYSESSPATRSGLSVRYKVTWKREFTQRFGSYVVQREEPWCRVSD